MPGRDGGEDIRSREGVLDDVVDAEAFLGRRLRKASKEDLVQMALGLSPDPLEYLRCRNPWALREFLMGALPDRAKKKDRTLMSAGKASSGDPEGGADGDGGGPIPGGEIAGAAGCRPDQSEFLMRRRKMMAEAEAMSLSMSVESLETKLEVLQRCQSEPFGADEEAGAALATEVQETREELARRLDRLTVLEEELGRYQALAVHYEEAIPLTEDESKLGKLLILRGCNFEHLNDFPKAEQVYREALVLGLEADAAYWVRNNLAYCLNVLERFAEAEPFCREAIGLRADRHNAYKNLALSLQGQGRFEEAALSFVRAVERSPSDARAYLHLQALVQDHPELLRSRPGLEEELERCRQMVQGPDAREED